jgi:alpha/beta superfamily hydrolase
MDNKILEIFIPGPAGRLEAKYYKSKKKYLANCTSATTTPSIWRNHEQ